MEAKKILRKLGFSEYASKVLLYLSSVEGAKNAKDVAEGSGVPLTKLYSLLLDLEERGLVDKLPGNVNQYRISGNIADRIGSSKEKEIEEKREQVENLTDMLKSSIGTMPSEEVSVNYFTSGEDYWKVYNEEVSKLRDGELYRIINNIRWSLSFLPEEVEGKPGIRSMIEGDVEKVKRGDIAIHHMVNARRLVENIVHDLEGREKIKRSVAQLLYYHSRGDIQRNHLITLAPEFKNILIVILKDSTFFEFYPEEDHSEISSAIQIKSREIADDFSSWFDAYSQKEHDPKKDYEIFREEMLRWTEEIAGVGSGEVEKAIEEAKPVYG